MASDRERVALARLDEAMTALSRCQKENQRLREISERREYLEADNADMSRTAQRHQSRVLEFQAALLQLGAKAHRAKWAFDDEEYEGTADTERAFDILHNLGDLALKFKEEL